MRKDASNLGMECVVIKEVGSGESMFGRPKLMKMLSDLKEDDVVGVYDQSRLSRSDEESFLIVNRITEAKAKLMVNSKFLDIEDPQDRAIFGFNSVIASYSRRIQMQKSQDGQKAAKESGNWVTRGDMLGWNVYKTRGQTRAEVDPIAQKYIEYIFKEYSTGRSFRSIANDLKDVVIPGSENYRFAPDTIERIVNQPLYMGYNMTEKKRKVLRYTRQQLEPMLIKSNIYPPLITEELFWKCYESYRTVHRKHATQYQYRNAAYELSTVFKCAYCSAKWTHHYDKEHGKGVYEKYRSLAHTCHRGSYRDFNKNALETLVRVTLILTFLDHDEVSCFFQSEREKIGIEKSEMTSELNNIEHFLSKNKQKIEKLTDLALEDGIPREVFKEKIKDLNEENRKLTESRNSLLNDIAMKEAQIDDFYADLTRDVLDEYAGLEPPLRRDMLKRYIFHAYVREDGFEIEYLNGKKFITDMWKKRIKKLTPLTIQVSFKGEEQYRLKVDFLTNTVKFEEVADDVDGFFSKRNERMEKEVNRYLTTFEE